MRRNDELVITRMVFVTEGDEASVSFAEEDFQAFEKILHEDDYVVGWWHSHPGYGLFLSNTDIETHIYSFQLHNNYSVALVIEPINIGSDEISPFKIYQVVGKQGKTEFNYCEIGSFISRNK